MDSIIPLYWMPAFGCADSRLDRSLITESTTAAGTIISKLFDSLNILIEDNKFMSVIH